MTHAQFLSEQTRAFYQALASEFSETREHAWPGWDQLLAYIPQTPRPLSVLDIAAGNGRFSRFLAKHKIDANIRALDACEPLMQAHEGTPNTTYVTTDLLEEPLESSAPGTYNVVACFGFMHHISGTSARLAFLTEALAKIAPGGIAAFSFWQFAKDIRIMHKAQAVTQHFLEAHPEAHLESGDFMLGWRARDDVFRLCHNFEDQEVLGLANEAIKRANMLRTQAKSAQNLHNIKLAHTYHADGKTGDANFYLVFSA